MSDNNDNNPPQKPLLEFPCDFPIKIFGLANEEFEAAVKNTLQEVAPHLADTEMTSRLSDKENYLAISMTLHVTSQEELDNIYRALTACPQVKMVL